MIKKVAILGAGPAGLLAAHAANQRGYQPHIFSRPGYLDGLAARSELWGCQYLHRHIPGLGLPPQGRTVKYLLQSEPDAYRRKVYGESWQGQVSPDEYGPEGEHQAWDLRRAYKVLWENWSPYVVPLKVTPAVLRGLLRDRQINKIFVTIPAPALCERQDSHKFVTRSIYAIGTAPGSTPPFTPQPFTVQCNGEDAPRWYRAANVYGYTTIEWPDGPKPPINGIARVEKPLSTDCDCNRHRKVVRLGRHGLWRKGVLVHDAYDTVMESLR